MDFILNPNKHLDVWIKNRRFAFYIEFNRLKR